MIETVGGILVGIAILFAFSIVFRVITMIFTGQTWAEVSADLDRGSGSSDYLGGDGDPMDGGF